MLEIEGLRFEQDSFDLDLSLRLEKGERGVVLGRSGSGKTTLLRLIAGFLRPARGSISLNGRRIDRLPPERRDVGIVFQGDALFPTMRVRENLEFGPRMAGMGGRERRRFVEELAESMGLTALLERMPRGLSGGERQRVALARTLATRPALILFDEALSSLDPDSRSQLSGEIARRCAASEIASLHVSHDADEVLETADRIFVMEGGRIVDRGSSRELFESPASAATVRFFASGPLVSVEGREKGDESTVASEFWVTPIGRFSIAEGRFGEGIDIGEARLFLPASKARFSPAEPRSGPGPDRVSVSVSGRSYRGARCEVRLRASGSDLEFLLELAEGEGPAIGDELTITFPRGCTRLVREAGRDSSGSISARAPRSRVR
jgi:ABC-type Fe3+/spermidine/putrescine transport system ATPase subunit